MTVNPSECAAYHGSFAEKLKIEWQQGMNLTYGIPQGCVVRNTFLEWQEYEFETKGVTGGDGSDESEASSSPLRLRPESVIRRCQSMPEFPLEEILPQPGLQRARTCQQPSPGKLLTADTLQAWGDDETSPGESGGSGPMDEEDGSEDLYVEPWSRRGHREYSDQGKWNSPTSYSGKSPKSRREFGRDFFDSKDGKGAKSRARDVDSPSGKSTNGSVLTLRGLPFQTTEGEVLSFVEEAGCKPWLAQVSRPVHLLSNAQGRPSGYAEIQLGRFSDYHEVRAKLHMQYFGQRYVEVLPHKQSAPLHSNSGHSGRSERDRFDSDRHDRDRRDRDRADRNRSWRR